MSDNLKKRVMDYNYYSLLDLIKAWTISFRVIVHYTIKKLGRMHMGFRKVWWNDVV